MRKYSKSAAGALFTAAAATLAHALLAPGAAQAAPAESESCPPGAIFGVGGTWDPTGQTTRPVTDRYAAQGYAAKPVTYPASFWPLGALTYDQSVATGSQALRRDIDRFHAHCPGSAIVVTGYSQGARIAGDVLGDIARDGSIPQNRIEGVLYADPRDPDGGIETVVPNVVPGVTMSGVREGFGAARVRQVCAENDGICNMPRPADDPELFVDSVFGYFTEHGTYQPMMAQVEPPRERVRHEIPSAPRQPANVAAAIATRVAENITPYVSAVLTPGRTR